MSETTGSKELYFNTVSGIRVLAPKLPIPRIWLPLLVSFPPTHKHTHTHTYTPTHPHTYTPTHIHTSPLHTVPATRTQLQLWQFLLELLLVSPNAHLIQWTDDEYEFQINKPTEVAQLWGKCTNNPSMNYEKLARGLRYYYQKGIMNKVSGRKLTFTYAGSVRDYVKMRRSQIPASHKELVAME